MRTLAHLGGIDPFRTSQEAAAGAKPHSMTSSQATVGLCYNETLSHSCLILTDIWIGGGRQVGKKGLRGKGSGSAWQEVVQ